MLLLLVLVLLLLVLLLLLLMPFLTWGRLQAADLASLEAYLLIFGASPVLDRQGAAGQWLPKPSMAVARATQT